MIRANNSRTRCFPPLTDQKALCSFQEIPGSRWHEPHSFFAFVPGLLLHLLRRCPGSQYFFPIRGARPHTDLLLCYRRLFVSASVSQFRAVLNLPCHPLPARTKFVNFRVDFL